ncbi:MAG: HD domain-containing protein [Gemmatimonadetes bacterium]|nr:HD domain-containing protein [Gemmatimonadota bacterium]MCY3610753.1 HD domain-containing protein [Gemmatimonadota bacterium]MCY3676774.1 HD domain-containing protein [Gemmatimonadota bacterium]MYA42562.1 HD domain-containing protein [Gemmatimonadota bacterium]MYE92394.1 HD domain-containing protein [Gemmatimonadota bacterium]
MPVSVRMRAPIHPIVAAAAEGRLPGWAVAGTRRRRHTERVADLLEDWAREMGLGEETVRWRAAGILHDALRDAPPAELIGVLPRRLRKLPPKAYHGPAAAILLRADGVSDRELLRAVRWHTLGSKKFGRLGKALFAADSLEPGRTGSREWRDRLRARACRDLDRVATEIVRNRIDYRVRAELPVHPRTIGFWNSLVRAS